MERASSLPDEHATVEVDQFRSALRTRPFRPFAILTADGERVPVTHPENVAITPSGRTVIVADDEGQTVIDMAAITKFGVTRLQTRRRPREE
jgi:hypothetical protein